MGAGGLASNCALICALILSPSSAHADNSRKNSVMLACFFMVHHFDTRGRISRAPALTFFPSQPCRKPSLPGGSAAKVSEPRSQNQINSAKAGRVLCRPPGRLGFREFWDERGRLFLVHFLLARQKKVTSCRATPGQRSVVLRTLLLQRSGPSTSSGRTEREVAHFASCD